MMSTAARWGPVRSASTGRVPRSAAGLSARGSPPTPAGPTLHPLQGAWRQHLAHDERGWGEVVAADVRREGHLERRQQRPVGADARQYWLGLTLGLCRADLHDYAQRAP